MTAFFFGPAEGQLFGYYHMPRGAGTGAVLLCPSWGPEYQYAHRTLRIAARRFTERGFHALRFDYAGTGDSWGDGTVGDMDLWVENTRQAIDELKAMSGESRVDLVGIRLGAYVATATAIGRRDVRRLILWDPVVDGSGWVGEIAGDSGPPRPGPDGKVELGQRLITASLMSQMERVSGASFRGASPERVLLLETSDDGGRRRSVIEGALPGIHHQVVEDAHAWEEDTSIWNGMVPARAIGAMTEWLVAP
jgi:pimeloyl-ACP methyl ester carboxylesterase